MRMRSLDLAASLAVFFLAAVGCDEKKQASSTAVATASVAGPAAPAGPSAPAAPSAPTPATPGRCRAKGAGPVKIGTVVGDVFGFASDATALYYSAWSFYGRTGDLGQVRKDGGGTKSLLALQLEPRGLAIDDDTIYFTSGIRLLTLPKKGGVMGSLAPKFSAQNIAVDGTRVYGVPGDYGPYDRVAAIPKLGGDTVEIASAKRAQSDGALKGYSSIAVDASGIYVADTGGKRVLRFPLKRGGPTTLASATKPPYDVAIGQSKIYFTVSDGDLMAVAKAGGAATKLASGLVEKPRIAADDAAIYTTFAGTKDDPQAKLTQVVVQDGTMTPIAYLPDPQTVDAIEIDRDCVYWVQRQDASQSFVYAIAR
jgi:hypothetical protein